MVQTLTNMKDHGRLIALQERMNAVLRHADVCLSQNKKMRIDDPKDNRAAADNHTAAGTGAVQITTTIHRQDRAII